MIYKKNIKLDYVHTFLRNLNFTQAIWVLYLANNGFTLLDIGLFESVFHLTGLAMEVPTGIIADLYGRKTSRILGIISYLVYIIILLTTTNYFLVVVGFIFCALGFVFESGSGEALVYDSLKEMDQENEFMRVNGNKEILYQLGSTIGILIGGFMAMVYLEVNYYATIGLLVLALIVITLMKEVPIKIERKTFKVMMKDHFVTTWSSAFKHRRAFFLILIGVMIAAPVTTIFLYMPNYMEQAGYANWVIGLVIASHAFFAAIGGYFAHRLEKRFKEKKILYFAPLFLVGCFWLTTMDTVIFYAFAFMGFVDTILYIVISDYLNKIVPSEVRASVLSVFGMMFSFIMIIIFPVIGYIGDGYGLHTGFFVLAIIVSIIYLLLLIILKGNHLVTRKDENNEGSNLSHT